MQMVSDVPIGAFLSGGIDSSAVVAFMAKHSDAPVQDLCDRLRRRRRPTATTTSCRTRARSPSCSAPTTTRSWSGPTSSRCCRSCCGTWTSRSRTRAFVTTYLVSEFARRDVTVILSGVGGDELFGGYRRYLGEHYMRVLRRLPRRLRARGRRAGATACRATGIRALLNCRATRRAFSQRPTCRSTSATARMSSVFAPRRGRANCLAVVPPDALRCDRRAFADDDRRRCAQSDARGRRRDAAARRPAAAHRQDDDGDVARMPRSAARSRAGGACARIPSRRQGSRRTS